MSLAQQHFQRGVQYMTNGDYRNAVSELSHAIRLDPAKPDYYMRRGDAFMELGDFEKSTSDYDQSNQIHTS